MASLFQVYRSLFHQNKEIRILSTSQTLKATKETSQIPEVTISTTSSRTSDGFEEISRILEPSSIHLHNFPDDEAKKWFYSSTHYKIKSKKCPKNSCQENGVLFNDSKENLT